MTCWSARARWATRPVRIRRRHRRGARQRPRRLGDTARALALREELWGARQHHTRGDAGQLVGNGERGVAAVLPNTCSKRSRSASNAMPAGSSAATWETSAVSAFRASHGHLGRRRILEQEAGADGVGHNTTETSALAPRHRDERGEALDRARRALDERHAPVRRPLHAHRQPARTAPARVSRRPARPPPQSLGDPDARAGCAPRGARASPAASRRAAGEQERKCGRARHVQGKTSAPRGLFHLVYASGTSGAYRALND